jgi:hypothetical protein
MGVKLGGWQRIGVILSVLWFVGFGVFMFEHEMSRHGDFHMWQLGNCYKIAEMRREPLQPNDPAYASRDAQIERDLKDCRDRASAFFTKQVGDFWSNLWILPLVDLASIALAWLFVWIVVSLVRWVSRGFQKLAAK